MAKGRPALSVCCLSGMPLARTAEILSLFRGVADEIVCAVDARVPSEEIHPLEAVADRVIRCELDAVSSSERNLAWLHAQCSGRWILRVDGDEVPSRTLLQRIGELVDGEDVLQYLIPRLWLWPDERHYVDEYPWSYDWQIRLIRNEPAFVRFEGMMHTSVSLALPYRRIDEPLYHLDCLVNSVEDRRAKADRYNLRRPGHVTERGFPVNGFYVPEDFSTHAPAPVPSDDLKAIEAVMTASARSTRRAGKALPLATLEETDRYWAGRVFNDDAYQARIQVLEPLQEISTGQRRDVLVKIHNDGSETWPWGDFPPTIRPASRWFLSDGQTIHVEGPRAALTADLHPGTSAIASVAVDAPDIPGDYVLELNLVHEHVRWFDAGARMPVRVTAATDVVIYDADFFEDKAAGSRASAQAVMDVVLALPIGPIASAVDVGCGIGTWGAELMARGIEVVGVDGSYVDTNTLHIPSSQFVAHDLTAPLDLKRRFDLVVSVEVIEHLSVEFERQFVADLVRHGDLVLFSGAIPGQGGLHHVNERWASHWVQLFSEHEYRLFDIIRPALWNDPAVEWWYRQNVMLFAQGAVADRIEQAGLPSMAVLDVIHPDLYKVVTGA